MQKTGDDYRTPPEVYEYLNKEFNFDFDPCPFKASFNGLNIDWGVSNFVNPPYSETEKWILKSIAESKKGKTVVLLLRLDASTKWFRDLLLPNAEIRLIYDRLKFIDLEGKRSRSRFASIIAILNGSKKRLNLEVVDPYKRKEGHSPSE